MAAGKIDDLSEAERDAIISKLMNQEAKMICDPLVKGWLCLAVFFFRSVIPLLVCISSYIYSFG